MEQAFTGPVNNIEEASENLRFSAAVAGFGMFLRESEFIGDFTLPQIINMAKGAKGDDEEGYRGEFIRLAKTVKDLNMVK